MNYYALDEALALIDGRELSLEFHVNSLIESGKLLTESIDITSLNEAEGAKSFKEKIVNALRKVIEKIKNFIKWIGTKVKALWMKIKAKVTGFNLKEKLKKAQEKAKAGKVNESVELVTEGKTLAELEEWLNEKYDKIPLYQFDKQSIATIIDNGYDIHYNEKDNAYVYNANWSFAYPQYGKTRKVFIEYYEKSFNDAFNMIQFAMEKKDEFEKKQKEFEDDLRKIDNISVNSIDDLKNAFKSVEDKEKIGKMIAETSKSITAATNVITTITKIATEIEAEAARINKYLSGNEE
jgi:molybdopterin converting factor small subunit